MNYNNISEKKLIELNEYDRMHKEDLKNNYGIEDVADIEKDIEKHKKLAEHSYINYDKLSIEDLRKLVCECLTDKEVRYLVLDHELKYYNNDAAINMSLTEFGKVAKGILDRYQCKAGGFLIEDNIWLMHTYQSKDHNIKKNELLFENSIDLLDIQNNETQKYLDRIERRLNMISTNISVEIRYKTSKKDNLMWILIWCTDKNIKKNKISL